MIKTLDKYSIEACCGGKGECQCIGTNDPMESVFGPFRRMTENEVECMHWCIEEKRGTKWKFLSNSNPLSFFGFGGNWHIADVSGHVKAY